MTLALWLLALIVIPLTARWAARVAATLVQIAGLLDRIATALDRDR